MARNEIVIAASPEKVFEMLADGRSYGHWVVGSSEIRDIDPGWPAEGSRFHHKVGWGPFKLSDHTQSVRCEPPNLLELRAKARPLGTARVRLELSPHKLGTRVVMVEDAGDAISALIFNPLTHLLVRGRNVESLRRLKAMVEGRGPSPAEAATS